MTDNLDKRITEFDALHDKVNTLLLGHDVDNIIPVLACMLAHAGYLSESNAETLKNFMAETIDSYYEEQGPQGASPYEH